MKLEQRRRLTDLYVKGRVVTLNDDSGEPAIDVWVRKMTPVDMSTALTKANAARVRLLSLKKQTPPSEEWLSVKNEVIDLDREILLQWAIQGKFVIRKVVIMARIAFENGWNEDNYLNGLEEEYASEEFQQKLAEEPDNESLQRIALEYERYIAECEAEYIKELERLNREFDTMSDEELQEYILDEQLKLQADTSWLMEYQKCMVWLCCFDNENRKQRMFESRAEVDEVQPEVLTTLFQECEALNVPDAEGKD